MFPLDVLTNQFRINKTTRYFQLVRHYLKIKYVKKCTHLPRHLQNQEFFPEIFLEFSLSVLLATT